jgi:phosphate transport system protein
MFAGSDDKQTTVMLQLRHKSSARVLGGPFLRRRTYRNLLRAYELGYVTESSQMSPQVVTRPGHDEIKPQFFDELAWPSALAFMQIQCKEAGHQDTVSTAPHLEESLRKDIEIIRGKIVEMARLVEGALTESLRSWVEKNRQLAYAVILRDQRIDELEKEIDRLCLEFLVRQQPVAGQLRFVYAAIKINAELERIGDYAESIARQILKIEMLEPGISHGKFKAIAELAIPMVGQAVRAFVAQDAELARATMEVEPRVNMLRDEINVDLLRAEKEGRLPLEALTPLITIARRFERVSDQAKNICEEVLYMCTGEYMKHRWTDVVRILFVDQNHACLSVMAEAIGASLGRPKLSFSSAGLNPRPIDAQTLEFLAEKGLRAVKHEPRSVRQTTDLERFQLVVVLAPEAGSALPQSHSKTIVLDWTIPDPSRAHGTAQVRANYEEAYRLLATQISDLAEAILDDKQ